MHDRDGEHSAVVCMLEYNRPPAASASRFGVAIGLPKQPSCPYPTSSSTMNSTFGEPASARSGRGQAGLDSSVVRPITPGNAVPGSYSFSGMIDPHRRNGRGLCMAGAGVSTTDPGPRAEPIVAVCEAELITPDG